MKKYINIADVTGFKPTLETYNKIEVHTYYKKGAGLCAYIQEWNHKNEWDYISFCFDLYGSKRVWFLILEMKRRNAKKIAEAEAKFFEKSEQEIVNILIDSLK